MSKYDKRVDDYIAKAAPFAQPILEHLRELVHEACPDVEEAWKWSFPNFVYCNEILCSMAAFKEHAVFGFWKAALLEDEKNILTTAERHSMGHLGRLTTLKDLPKDKVLKDYMKRAMKLNEEGIKVAKPKAAPRTDLDVPDYFMKALKKDKDALKTFNAFSLSNKREYVEWVTEAKTEATRDKRLAQAIEWMAEGKSRNWKYNKK